MTDGQRDEKRLTGHPAVPLDPLTLLDLAHDALLMQDRESRIIFVNRQAVRLYGWQREELLGQVIHEVIPTRYVNSAPREAEDLDTTGYFSGELVRRRRDGSMVTVHCTQVAQYENGDLIGCADVSNEATKAWAYHDDVRTSGEMLRLLLDGATDYAIFMLNPSGRITSWSASAQRLTGYPEADVLGEHYGMLFTPSAMADGEPDRILARCAQGQLEVEGERAHKDGTRYWVIGTMTPVCRDDGKLRGFVKVAHDGTKRHRDEVRFRGLLAGAPDAMIVADSDGRIVFANKQTERLFGYSQYGLLGQQVEMLLPARLRKEHIGHRGRFMNEPTTRPMGADLQLMAVRRDGSEFPVDVSLSALESDEGLIVSANVRDVSERKRTQQAIKDLNHALRRANDELEQRVASRTATLAAQAAQLQASNNELDAFSYSVSHDLRSPLRAVDGFAWILAANYADVLDDAGRRYLDKVRAGAQHMGMLIDGLLSFSRLQRQSLARRTVDMVALCREIWGELESERVGRDVQLTVADLPRAYADAQLLRHVLSNLLNNALKFTRTRHPARIDVATEADDRGGVVYMVRDNGVGFDMRYVDKLFKVFQRLHRAEDYEGTGIGLALTARIIQRHGGTIWADGSIDRGAVFRFTLPHNQFDDSDTATDSTDQP